MTEGDPIHLAGSKIVKPKVKRCPWLEYRVSDDDLDKIYSRPRKHVTRTIQLAADLKQAREVVYKIYDISNEDKAK